MNADELQCGRQVRAAQDTCSCAQYAGYEATRVAKRISLIVLLVAPWPLAGIVLWYAWPAPTPLELRPGDTIRAFSPDILRALKLALFVCWLGMLGVLLWSLARPRKAMRSRDWIAVALMVGGILFGLVAGGMQWPIVVGALWAIGLILIDKSRRLRAYPALALLAFIPIMVYPGMGGIWSMWRDVAEVESAGQTYHLQYWSSFQARGSALSEEVTRTRAFLVTRVLVVTTLEGGLLLVRPAGQKEYDLDSPRASYFGTLRLVTSADGRCIAPIYLSTFELPGRTACVAQLAYDTVDRRGYSFETQEFSPFILIGPTDDLATPDVRALLSGGQQIANGSQFAGVLADTRDPNPRVRAVCAKLLSYAGPQRRADALAALRRLSESDPDQGVRTAARTALGKLATTL
jgi:hypothetical protein